MIPNWPYAVLKYLFHKKKPARKPRAMCACGKTVAVRKSGRPYKHVCRTGAEIASAVIEAHEVKP